MDFMEEDKEVNEGLLLKGYHYIKNKFTNKGDGRISKQSQLDL